MKELELVETPPVPQTGRPKVEDVYGAFAELGRFGKVVVAGGAVRDQLMAKTPKDYDLFILTNRQWDDDVAKAVKELTQRYPTITSEG